MTSSVSTRHLRMSNLLEYLGTDELPSSVVPVFHSRATFFKPAPIRFTIPAAVTVSEVLEALEGKTILVVLFDEKQKPYSYCAFDGKVIQGPGQLGNDKVNNRGRWFLRRFSGNDLLSMMRALDGKDTHACLLHDETSTPSLRELIERMPK